MKKAFIIGTPIEHSLSPHLHGFWLDEYDIDGGYEAMNIPAEYLVKAIRKLQEKGYEGGNVTIPHKEKVLMICDEVEPLARKVGAVNTLVFAGGKIYGYNTDVFGFMENLRRSGVDFSTVKNALIIGAGGAARAVIVGLKEQGVNLTITNRTEENAIKLSHEFGIKLIDWHQKDEDLSSYDLVVNTTSLGLKNQNNLEINLSTLPKHAVVHDIVYNPLETTFLKQAKGLGLKTVDGLGMLLYQAVPGFEKWFGKHPTVTTELREHLLGQMKS